MNLFFYSIQRRAFGRVWICCFFLLCGFIAHGQQYDLLIKGGRVIDPKTQMDRITDVAIIGDTVAMVADAIDEANAKKTIQAEGLLVVPGLIDLHTHVFVGSRSRIFANGNYSVSPDNFTFRSGVTTVVDAGTSGWRSFPEFKENVIDQSQTRVLAFLNITGQGMVGFPGEQDLQDMDPWLTSNMAKRFSDHIVGVKIGHYEGPHWDPFDRALEAAESADIPLLVECHLPQYSLQDQLGRMRSGDILTHIYEQVRDRAPIVDAQGKVLPYVLEARDKGVLFDVSHGGAGFRFRQAIPAMEQGIVPHTFGTDLHRFSMNSGMKDMANLMSKFLAMGMTIEDVIMRATWGTAQAIKRRDLGRIEEGTVADIAILRLRDGEFGFVDSGGDTIKGTRKFEAEVTIRGGNVVYDLNGISFNPLTIEN